MSLASSVFQKFVILKMDQRRSFNPKGKHKSQILCNSNKKHLLLFYIIKQKKGFLKESLLKVSKTICLLR